MSGIRSKGRPGSQSIPRWRMDDPELDAYDFRVACWLASHTEEWASEHVTRNAIARALNVSGERVGKSLTTLSEMGVVEVETVEIDQSKGGKRLVIYFDHDAWEKQPRSCDDQAPGRVATTPGRVATATTAPHVEENLETSIVVASDSGVERTPGQLAHEVASALYDKIKAETGKRPVGWTMVQMVKLLSPFFEAGWEVAEVKHALWACHTSGTPITRQTVERFLDGRQGGSQSKSSYSKNPGMQTLARIAQGDQS